jgi:hypothetical protein
MKKEDIYNCKYNIEYIIKLLVGDRKFDIYDDLMIHHLKTNIPIINKLFNLNLNINSNFTETYIPNITYNMY